MRQTLFTIDHFWFTGPIFWAWLVVGLLVLIYLYSKHGIDQQIWNFLPVFLIVAAIVYFVLPQLEVTDINPANPNGPRIPVGLAVRGYGFFLLLGMVSGIGLAIYRCLQIGIDPDRVLTLAFWMIVFGILGARLFFIIQKWDEFGGKLDGSLIVKMLDMTKGGLVVYGSLIGGTIAAVIYLKWAKISIPKMIDVLAPAMVLGLAVGRIGCLMNGCCFGGVCDPNAIGVQFPAGSPPYVRQMYTGELFGARFVEAEADGESRYPIQVRSVVNGSLAEKSGLRSGDNIAVQFPDSQILRAAIIQELDVNCEAVILKQGEAAPIVISQQQLPEKSLPTHPTQIYSSINAAALCLVLWFYFPYRRNEGEVFALMLILYSVGRFLLETIRRDELGMWGTQFTISQWVSLFAIILGTGLFIGFRFFGKPPSNLVPNPPPSGLGMPAEA